ncbi:MAG: porin family protein [Kangiellaceae bacterium]|nr:porin family protein [Kangiellaceae bacterium]
MRYLLFIALYIISFSIHAREDGLQDSPQKSNKHSWGAGLGTGAVVDGDESDSLTSGLFFYEYHYDENFSIYTKAFAGSSNDNFGGGVKEKGIQLSLKARANFLDSMSVYARFGVSLNDTKSSGISFNNSSSGVGFVGATGLEYLSDSGVIFGLELEYYDAGAVEIVGANLFIGVRF